VKSPLQSLCLNTRKHRKVTSEVKSHGCLSNSNLFSITGLTCNGKHSSLCPSKVNKNKFPVRQLGVYIVFLWWITRCAECRQCSVLMSPFCHVFLDDYSVFSISYVSLWLRLPYYCSTGWFFLAECDKLTLLTISQSVLHTAFQKLSQLCIICGHCKKGEGSGQMWMRRGRSKIVLFCW